MGRDAIDKFSFTIATPDHFVDESVRWEFDLDPCVFATIRYPAVSVSVLAVVDSVQLVDAITCERAGGSGSCAVRSKTEVSLRVAWTVDFEFIDARLTHVGVVDCKTKEARQRGRDSSTLRRGSTGSRSSAV